MIIGVDEAGRGPILGPMVLCAVALRPSESRLLRTHGVADSKSFGAGDRARERRRELASLVEETATHCLHTVVEVEEIDAATTRGELNVLERLHVTKLLERLTPGERDTIVCDGATLFASLRTRYPRLRAVDRAESVHVAVAAASIVAKHVRDEAMAAIAERYRSEFGPIQGGGYVNPATLGFLQRYRTKYGCLPPEARSSWRVGALDTPTPAVARPSSKPRARV